MTFSMIPGPGLPRIAVSLAASHPHPDRSALHSRLAKLAEVCGAQVRVFHTHPPDLAALSRADRALVGSGCFVPIAEELLPVDIDHTFRWLAPERVASLKAMLREAGTKDDDVLARYEVRAGFALARAMQACSVDLACSHYFDGPSISMFVAAQLLDVPWVFLECPGASQREEVLFRLMLARAALLVPQSRVAAAALATNFASLVTGRCAKPTAEDGGADALHAMRALLARPRSAAASPVGARAAYVGEAGPRVELPRGMRPFLVLGAERTGSTMLVDALASQPGIACAGELFNPRGVKEQVCPWLPGVSANQDVLNGMRAAGPHVLIQELFRQAAAQQVTWCGFKLLYYHGAAYPRVLGDLLALPGLHVVHQLRANRLQRWLSHCRAVASDSWYTLRGEGRSGRAGPIALDVNATVRDFLMQEAFEERYRAIFAGCAATEIEYEELASAPPALLSRLGRFFGAELGAFVAKSEKTGKGRLRESIANFDALRDAFAGTRWEGLFHDGGEADPPAR